MSETNEIETTATGPGPIPWDEVWLVLQQAGQAVGAHNRIILQGLQLQGIGFLAAYVGWWGMRSLCHDLKIELYDATGFPEAERLSANLYHPDEGGLVLTPVVEWLDLVAQLEAAEAAAQKSGCKDEAVWAIQCLLSVYRHHAKTAKPRGDIAARALQAVVDFFGVPADRVVETTKPALSEVYNAVWSCRVYLPGTKYNYVNLTYTSADDWWATTDLPGWADHMGYDDTVRGACASLAEGMETATRPALSCVKYLSGLASST